MNLISLECYYWVALILTVISTIAIGILSSDENPVIGSVGQSGFEVVGLAAVFCFMWPIIIGFCIAALVIVLPIWLIFQFGKWVGRTFIKQGE